MHVHLELCPALRRSSSSEDNEDNMSLAESLLQGARPVAPSVHLRSKSSMMSLIKEEPRLPASEPEVSRLLGYRLGRHACSGQVREGCAAFGHLAELATRRRSPLRPAAPQEALSSPSSLPGRSFVPAERCKPPYSREWLRAHRAHCGGSPLRPTAFATRVVPTHPQPASAPAAASMAHGAAKPLLKMNACEGRVREGGAAFGRLAELATRGGAAAMSTAPQEALQLSPSSLPRRIFVPAELSKPPYSREWLRAHRAHCGGSLLRPTAFAARAVPTHPQPASAPAAAGTAHGAAKPLLEDDTTPDSVYALLASLEMP